MTGPVTVEDFHKAVTAQFEGAGEVHMYELDAWAVTGYVLFPNGLRFNLPVMGNLREVAIYGPYWREKVSGVMTGKIELHYIESTVPERLAEMKAKA